MTSIDHPAGTEAFATARPGLLRWAPALYAATLFASALLLFSVQPLFAKIVLPRLGGSPSVWSVAMVFFQAALLAGYAYAHALSRMATPARAALIHLGLLAIAGATLPIAIASGFATPPADGVALWLFALFAASIGLPFVALSASAPLLQSWFAASGHPQARNPYVLYAASNLGSFAALIAYPALIEPLLPLKTQTAAWSVGFALVALLIAIAALVVAVTDGAARDQMVADQPLAPPNWRQRIGWMGLAAAPSGLTIAVTAHISTDVAAAPFLWVVPLALYLLTFVAVFRERPWISHARVVWLVPFVVAPAVVGLLAGNSVFWLTTLVLNMVVFVLLTLLCHGELYARRPSPAQLTEFYLWVSLGGVIGGAFAGLIAPHMFNGTYEYPILITAALLALPGAFAGGPRTFLRMALPGLTLAAGVVAIAQWTNLRVPTDQGIYLQIGLVLLVAGMLLQRHRPALLFSLLALGFAITETSLQGGRPVEVMRSFFGVLRVVETADGSARVLMHGTTLHGVQRLRTEEGAPASPPEPLAYYYFGGPISDGIAASRMAQGRLNEVAVIGLGTGSLACHRRPDERWTFFEIDAAVVRIARDERAFNFLSDCAPQAPIVIGDARLTFEQQQKPYDLLVLDAFSSDSIPAHLLTREAFASYLSRLSPSAALVVHISNRHMELAPVVAAVGRTHGLVAFLKEDRTAGQIATDLKANARVVVLARTRADLGDLPSRPGWSEIKADPSVHAWTDDYSNLLEPIWRMKMGR